MTIRQQRPAQHAYLCLRDAERVWLVVCVRDCDAGERVGVGERVNVDEPVGRVEEPVADIVRVIVGLRERVMLLVGVRDGVDDLVADIVAVNVWVGARVGADDPVADIVAVMVGVKVGLSDTDAELLRHARFAP